MGIFNFFASRDVDLEATILAEKELEVPSISIVENTVVEEEVTRTTEADEVMEDVESLPKYTLSRAEFFYLDCQVKNPKDVWNEFTVVDNSSFDFSKQTVFSTKKKKLFRIGKEEGKCYAVFGLIFTEDTSFKNWLNCKPEDLGFILPKSFEELENFVDGSNLEVFRCLDKEAINYETNALHLSAHMFFEKTEVKQKWQIKKL